MMKGPEVVIGVYDSSRQFVGYKSNPDWDLTSTRSSARLHLREDVGPEGRSVMNLLMYLNGGFGDDVPRERPFSTGEYDSRRRFFLVPELFTDGERLLEIVIEKGEHGYAVRESLPA